MKRKTLVEFDRTMQDLLDILSSLSEQQLNDSPSKDVWSAGQIGEHLLKSYASVETLLGKTKQTDRPIDEKIALVSVLFNDYSIKMESPEAIIPSDKPKVQQDLISALKERIEVQRDVIKNKDLSATCAEFAIPEYGEFTRLEWIWFNIIHTQRHIHQLKNKIQF